jgi:uncharacterized membrane protein YfcA
VIATAAVVIVIFLATLIRSSIGFGEALIAVPLLSLVLPVEVSAPLAVLFSITVALVIVSSDWRSIHIRSAVWLVIPTLFGIPLGLYALKSAPEIAVKTVLAVIIIGFSAWSLTRGAHLELKNDKLAFLFGFAAGVLGGAYGMNGPPLAVYGSLRRWTPANFRATLQGYFLPASIAGMVGYWSAGFWTPAVTRDYLIALPGSIAAIYLGRIINKRTHARRFVLYVHGGLIVIGAILLAQAWLSTDARF